MGPILSSSVNLMWPLGESVARDPNGQTKQRTREWVLRRLMTGRVFSAVLFPFLVHTVEFDLRENSHVHDLSIVLWLDLRSLSKTPNPQFLLTSWLVPCMAANRHCCVCVNG